MKEHQNNFSFLRLVGAILVIYGHSFPITKNTSPNFYIETVQILGIDIFFIISGYLITKSWLSDPHVIRYAIRRFLRIFPALFAVVLVSVFIIGPLFTTLSLITYFKHPYTREYLSNIFLLVRYNLPGVFTDNAYPVAVNGSLWSLPVEIFAYIILVPIALTLYKNKYKTFCSFFVFLVFVALQITFRNRELVVYGVRIVDLVRLLPFFFMGSFIAVSGFQKYLNLQVAFILLIFLLVLPEMNLHLKEILNYFFLPYIILSLGLSEKAFFSGLNNYGDYSYGLYLYGFLIQQSVSCKIGVSSGPLLNFVFGLLIAFVCAFLSWHLLEKKMLSIKPKTRILL